MLFLIFHSIVFHDCEILASAVNYDKSKIL